MCNKYASIETNVPVKRQSNIELLRILGLFVILCHHYVVNSGIMQNIDPVVNRGVRVPFLLGNVGKDRDQYLYIDQRLLYV